MTLDEAIKHAEEVAEKNERRAESVRNRPISSADFYNEEESCSKCAEEHRQLAKWLKELKAYREQSGDAISRQAVINEIPVLWNSDGDKDYCMESLRDFVAELPPVTPQQKMGQWIPVNERLPEVADCYAVTKQIGSDLIVSACYFDGINNWHNDNWINNERNYLTDIVAWMPLPEPYKAESEDKE